MLQSALADWSCAMRWKMLVWDLDIHKLARRCDAGGVAPQAQPCDGGGQRRVFRDGEKSLFHASIVDTVMVVSSSTSRSTRTVSSEVKMVTLFSVAQRRMMTPSSRWRPLWMARVLMM